MTYLLLVPDQVVEEERRFGLVAVWTQPCQAHLPSLDEVARKLALLISTGEDWAYAFMQLNKDSQHIPLITTRHISTMVNDAHSRSACGHLSHVEVHKLLQCGVEVVYPEGLNRGLELLQVSLPKLPIWDSDSHVESACEPLLLQVNLPRIVPQQPLTQISSPHSVMECPSDMVSHPSMTMDIEELLSIAMPDNLEQPPTGISPKSPTLMAPIAPIARGEEIPLEAGKIYPASLRGMPPSPQGSSQSGTANDMTHTSCSPSPSSPPGSSEETRFTSAPHSHASPRAICNTLPDAVLCIQEEMNNAMSHILTLWALLDARQWRLILDIETTLHQNEAKAAKAIKIVKACYAGTIYEAKAMYVMAIREAETNCSTSIMEVEGGHSTAVREVEATCAVCTLDLQQAHREAIRAQKVRLSRRMGRITNLSCWPAEQPSGPVPQSP